MGSPTLILLTRIQIPWLHMERASKLILQLRLKRSSDFPAQNEEVQLKCLAAKIIRSSISSSIRREHKSKLLGSLPPRKVVSPLQMIHSRSLTPPPKNKIPSTPTTTTHWTREKRVVSDPSWCLWRNKRSWTSPWPLNKRRETKMKVMQMKRAKSCSRRQRSPCLERQMNS